jgi:hypothetical protein
MVFVNSNWSYAAAGFTPVGGGVDVAMRVFGRQGYPRPQFGTVVADGRRREIQLSALGEPRLDNVLMLDARVAKTFRFAAVGLTVSADIFNVFNSDTVLQQNGDVLATGKGQIVERVGPRALRVGARLTF